MNGARVLNSRRVPALAILLAVLVGGAALYVARAEQPVAVVPVTSSPLPAAAPTVARAASPMRSSAAAAPSCTNPEMTTRAVIERYFDLSTSNSVQAVIDCFAVSWREKNATGPNGNTFTDAAARWSHAGPASDLVITLQDGTNGCDRYFVAAKMADGFPIGQGGSAFITIGPAGGTPRIFEIGTALANAQLATTTCR